MNDKDLLTSLGGKQKDGYFHVSLSLIRILKDKNGKKINKRVDMGDLKEFMEGIKKNGIQEPSKGFIGMDGSTKCIYLTNGERRYLAGKMAEERYGIKVNMPIIIIDRPLLKEMYATQVLSNDGKPFTMLETAEVYKSMMIECNMSQAELAEYFGRSTGNITELIILANASEEIKEYVKDKKINGTEASRILSKCSRDNIKALQMIQQKIVNDKESKIISMAVGAAAVSEKPNSKPNITREPGEQKPRAFSATSQMEVLLTKIDPTGTNEIMQKLYAYLKCKISLEEMVKYFQD